ncbi:MAG TPA: DUF2141 domain-containing protein [Geomonas sp.]|nr:DUF2141 domain-containing protein [Geomonas sp.]
MSIFCTLHGKSLKQSSLLLLCVCAFACTVVRGNACAESLTVKVTGLHGTVGNLQVMVWKGPEGFPTDPQKAVAHKVVPVSSQHMEVTFTGLARGSYAVAAYHDVNGNGKLDRSLLGWPVEPVGASNGATGVMGPPKFKDAVFELQPSSNQAIGVTLK